MGQISHEFKATLKNEHDWSKKRGVTVIPLAMVSEGERVEIVDFIRPGRSLFCRLRDIGISPGWLWSLRRIQ